MTMSTHTRALTCLLLTTILGLGLVLSGCQPKAEAPKEGAASEMAPAAGASDPAGATATATGEVAGTPAEATSGQPADAAAPATGEAAKDAGAEVEKAASGH
jgi:hypothetical protein